MYAVIKTGGKQYRVAPEDVLTVEKLPAEAGEIVQFNDVLLVGGDELSLGNPLVDGASVAAEVLEQRKGKTIIVFKKRRRKHYRRRNGHRQLETVVRITEILTGGKAPSKKAAAKKDAKSETKAAEKTDKAPTKKAAKTKDEPAADAPLFTAPKGEPDDLKKISGVGPVLEGKLNALGITQFAQIAKFTKADMEKVDEVLNFKGRVEREDWVAQAKALMDESKS